MQAVENKTKEKDNVKGLKYDDGKPPMHLLPMHALMAAAEVFGYGAKKYDSYNWTKGIEHSRLYSAIQRHLWAHWSGETEDPESGMPHLWHALCGMMMLTTLSLTRPDLDDRNKEEEGESYPNREIDDGNK